MELNAYTPETMIEASPGGKIDMTKVIEPNSFASFHQSNYELRVGLVFSGACDVNTECHDGLLAKIDCDS